MKISFSDQPGARERQLIRRYQNPLFGAYAEIGSNELETARSDDAVERDDFYRNFQKILQEIAEFSGQVESEKILEMKQRVDQMYEQCSGLAGDNRNAIDGLSKLQNMIMEAITQGAEGDANAARELKQEAVARELHQQLLRHKLICDLLRPDKVIRQEQLAATMLSEDIESVRAALILFPPRALQALIDASEKLIKAADIQGEVIDAARANLDVLKEAMEIRKSQD